MKHYITICLINKVKPFLKKKTFKAEELKFRLTLLSFLKLNNSSDFFLRVFYDNELLLAHY